jgi:hypothetical protein
LTVLAGMYYLPPSGPLERVETDPPEAANSGLQVARWKVPDTFASEPVADFTNGMRLVTASTAVAGGDLSVTLRWQALRSLAGDYTTTIQILDHDDKVLAQHDAYPLDGRYPTSLWSPNEQVQDVITLRAQDTYDPRSSLIVGLYRLPEVRPIPTVDGRLWAHLPLPGMQDGPDAETPQR